MRIGAPLNNEARPGLQWIELATSFQIPSFHIIGLPSPEVSESRERIRAAIEASGLSFPRRRVVINLSPASVRKRGTGIDLAMALAVLAAGEPRLEGPETPVTVAWGELGLDGRIKSAAQLTRAIHAAWEFGAHRLLLARSDLRQARESLDWIQAAQASQSFRFPPPVIQGAVDLAEAWEMMLNVSFVTDCKGASDGTGPLDPELPGPDCPRGEALPALLPIAASLERCLGTAAAGGHHLILLGPKGTGKTQALEWLTALQPPISAESRLRQVMLEELSQVGEGPRTHGTSIPIRRVGVSAKPAALLGWAGAGAVRPGECSLAHGGLLVADEFPEWARDSRECLREPLERSVVTLTRVNGSLELPARFTLAATGNLCPCGGWPPQIPYPLELRKSERSRPRCRCRPGARKSYLARLSGPVMDRVDMVQLMANPVCGGSDRQTVSAQEFLQLRRKVLSVNNALLSSWGHPPGKLSATSLEDLIRSECEFAGHLQTVPSGSARSRHKTARLALTLAAWDGARIPGVAQVMEASCYRPERYGLTD